LKAHGDYYHLFAGRGVTAIMHALRRARDDRCPRGSKLEIHQRSSERDVFDAAVCFSMSSTVRQRCLGKASGGYK
jgi:hypothetical protein